MSKAKDVACDNCGNFTFVEVCLIKFLSKIVSPNGEEGHLPVPTFACNACGYVNETFLPPYMRKPPEPKASEGSQVAPEEGITTPTPSAPPKIEIVR